MNMFIILIAIVIGIGVSVTLTPVLGLIAPALKAGVGVLFQVAWVALLLVTAVSVLSLWGIGLEFSGLTLIGAVIGAIIIIWVWGKTRTWQAFEEAV